MAIQDAVSYQSAVNGNGSNLVNPELVLMYANDFAAQNISGDLEVNEISRGFLESEIEVLQQGGFPLDEIAEERQSAADLVSQISAEYAVIASTAIDTSEAAKWLHVNPSRIRQRIGDHSLLAIQGVENNWLLPRFQFDNDGREIPGMRRVLQGMEEGLHPITINGFLNAPQPDLYSDLLQKPLSPKEWLKSGHPVEPVIDLARVL
ncbi:MAG: hypothetical protein U9Q75_02705 [Pseudomonadota bacterium]|nr:hypothetical protein [Pseudomonadota bacterium]